MPTKTLGVEGGWNVRSYIGWRGEQNILKVWKPLPRRGVSKTLRGRLKEKAQTRQYLLAVTRREKLNHTHFQDKALK